MPEFSNVLGLPFEKYVTKQINNRQKVLGENNKIKDSYLIYNNNKAPWIRLASGVNLHKNTHPKGQDPNSMINKLHALGLDINSRLIGSRLARSFVLQGGAVDMKKVVKYEDGQFRPQTEGSYKGLSAGILDNSNTNPFKVAYGWGGTLDDGSGNTRGFVPMPGITDCSVTYYNGGAFSTAKVNIRCWNRKQQALIETLYLTPGYSVLLEFGHSMFLNNDDTPKVVNSDPFWTKPMSLMFDDQWWTKEFTHFDFYKLIGEEKLARFGNYEGVFGFVTKYSWNLNKEGGYDCSLEITGMGDLIESLKISKASRQNPTINFSDHGKQQVEAAKTLAENPVMQGAMADQGGVVFKDQAILALAESTKLGALLFEAFMEINESGDKDRVEDLILPNFPDQDNNFKIMDRFTSPKALLAIGNVQKEGLNIFGSPQCYISFSGLIAILQSQLLIYDRKGDSMPPMFKFNLNLKDPQNDKNYIFRIPGSISIDPNKVLVVHDDPSNISDKLKYKSSDINEFIKKDGLSFIPTNPDDQYVGHLSCIYLNFNMLVNAALNSDTDAEGEISLLSFLQQLMTEITYCLGGINEIHVKSNTAEGMIEFIEHSAKRIGGMPSDEEFARFNTFGVKPGVEGSFVKNINLNSELTKDMVTMMVAASTFSGNSSPDGGKMGPAFQEFSKGMYDRIIRHKKEHYPAVLKKAIEDETNDPKKSIKEQIELFFGNDEKYGKNVGALIEWIYGKKGDLTTDGEVSPAKIILNMGEQGRQFNQTTCDTAQPIYSMFMKMCIDYLVGEKQIPAPIILPFNLSFELDGLAGMRLYERFLIDDRVLPPSYGNDNVDFIITAIDHTVTRDNWSTNIGCQFTPKNPNNPVSRPTNMISYETIQQGGGGGGGGGGGTDNLNSSIVQDNPPPPGMGGDELKRYNAMNSSYKHVFRKFGEISGMCGQYSFNLALNYLRYLKGKSGYPKKLASGGNAKQIDKWKGRLIAGGYKGYMVKQNISKADCIKYIANNSNFSYGDVAVYWGTDGYGSHRKYGHAQIYVGEINNTSWSTSKKTNYGGNMIYRGRNSTKWNIYVFKAPGSASQVNDTKWTK